MLFLEGNASFCETTAGLWGVIGWAVLLLKIVIPILLIIFGMLDLGKAVVASKEDEIKKGQQMFVKRIYKTIKNDWRFFSFFNA